MWNDLRTLLWVEWRRTKPVIAYWLKTLGCDPATSKFYQLYVLGFWGVWLYLAGAYAVDNAFRASAALPVAMVPLILQAVPYLILAGQLLYLATLLRDPPIHLTGADMAYIAASPVARRLVTLLHFGRTLGVAALPIAAVSGLLGATLTHIAAPALATMAGVQAFLVALPLTALSMAAAWSLAVLAVRFTLYPRRWWLWLAIPLLILAALVVPQIVLWPGIVWQATLGEGVSASSIVPLIGAVVAAVALLAVAGDVHMGIVAERSQTYARLEKLGFLARLYARDLIQRIERQSQLAKRRYLWPRLSTDATGTSAVLHRTIIASVRASWFNVLRPFAEGAFLTSLLIGLVNVGGAAFQTWLLVLVVLLVVRLSSLMQFFQQELDVPFMRQFVPTHPLALFAATVGWPGALATIGGIGAVLSQVATVPWFVAILVPFGVAALGLAQALDRVDAGTLGSRRLPYFYTVLIGGGLVLTVSVLLESIIAALIVLIIVSTVLAAVLYNSRLTS